MKIVFCKGGFAGSVSGADEILVNYAARLRASGHDPSVFVVYPHPEENPYAERLRAAGVGVTCLTRHPLYNVMRGARKLILSPAGALARGARGSWAAWQEPIYRAAVLMLKRQRPDVVHVLEPWGETPTLIRAAHAAGVPCIYHDFGTPGAIPDRDQDYDQLTEVISVCAEVAGLSPLLARLCRERFNFNGPASALPLMVEDVASSGVAAGAPGARGAEAVTFGFAARLEPLKGPTLLLEAFAPVLRAFPRARLRVAGSGTQESEVRARAEELGVAPRCEFTGAYAGPEEMSAFMRGVDVFVLPSYTEGTPNGIVEAMAHGLPVIASSVGGVPDMVSADSGVLVAPGDAGALADAMKRLASDAGLRARMGRAARERYGKLFSPEAVLPVLLETYLRVAAKGEPPTGAGRACAKLPAHPWAGSRIG